MDMNIVCLDLEGVLVPEIWVAFAEETGITKKISELREIYNCYDVKRHCIYYIYLAEVPSDMPIHLQIGETMDYAFLPYDEFRELVCSDRFVASEQGRFIEHEKLMKSVLDTNNI
jgi:ADP-ribose pyrophosphatase YjhB (NUDIX family)